MIDSNRRELRELRFKNRVFHLYFLNMDISVTIYLFKLRFSPCIHKIRPEGNVSQIFYLGPSFYLMAKKRVTFGHFILYKFLQFKKTKNRT